MRRIILERNDNRMRRFTDRSSRGRFSPCIHSVNMHMNYFNLFTLNRSLTVCFNYFAVGGPNISTTDSDCIIIPCMWCWDIAIFSSWVKIWRCGQFSSFPFIMLLWNPAISAKKLWRSQKSPCERQKDQNYFRIKGILKNYICI